MKTLNWLGVVLALPLSALAAKKEVAHPYMLWTKEEAAAIRQRIETDPLAKKQYERMVATEAIRGNNPPWLNLFKYAVLGDKAAGQAEKGALLSFIGQLPPGAKAGNPETGNAPWRDDRTLEALRYDVLYDELTPEQRKGVEDTIRGYVEWLTKNPGPLAKPGVPRTGWLPNMQWPTAAGIHVLAVASGDEKLIQTVFETTGGWKWYLDNYIVDGRFYMEEFGKYYSNIGAMMLWCEGLERLGLGQYGYGYTGKGGATMRNHLNMLIYAGYPRVNLSKATPDYPVFTMGDAGPTAVIWGYNQDGTGGINWWCGGRMNGSIRKMAHPLWYEMGHRRFPEDRYDYFLAQLRKPGEELYLPTLYFGLGPVDPAKVKPPAVKSFVAPERGLAMLRAEESPAYWESPKPAVGLQFAMYYVHYTADCFAIMQFVANNRMLYDRMGGTQGGYAGGDPWADHVNSKGSGVVVDGARAQYVDRGEEGCKNHRIRHHFAPTAKYTAIRAKGVYPNVEQERALVLTDEYLFDVFQLTSPQPRVYDWHVNFNGALTEGDWQPATTENTKPHVSNAKMRGVGDKPWSVNLQQADGAGVRVWMLGEGDTTLVNCQPPNSGGTHLYARRKQPNATFVALHEPFDKNGSRLREFTRIAQTDTAVAARVAGEKFSDRVLFSTTEEPVTLEGGGESFTLTGFGHVRVTAEKVEVAGNVKSLKIKVQGTPKLVLNGKETAAKVAGGVLEYSGS